MRRHGFTLLELAIILVLLATLCVVAAPGLLHGRAVYAVRAARAELIAAIATARAHAVLAGGAQLIIDPAGPLRFEHPDGRVLGDPIDLITRYGVSIQTLRGQPVTLRYDGLGIGRMTNTTIQLQRGAVKASVVVSAYGRPRI